MSDSVASENQCDQSAASEAGLVRALTGLTILARPSGDDSKRQESSSAVEKLFQTQEFSAWHASILTTRPVEPRAASTAADDNDPAAAWNGSKRKKHDANFLARWFHAFLLDHPDLLDQASDRDEAGKIFQAFYETVHDETLIQPFHMMESFVMTRLRQLGLMKSQRTGDTVFMLFANGQGKFPTSKQRLTAREQVLQKKKQEEASKEHVVISDAPVAAFVPLKEAHSFVLEVSIEDTVILPKKYDAKQIVLEDVTLSGPGRSRYELTHAPELPTDLMTTRLFEFTVTPLQLGVVRAKATFSFRKPDGETFAIVRHFSFRSGNNEALDTILAPTSPFKPKRRRVKKKRAPASKTYGPPPIAFAGKLGYKPFQVKLPQYKIPSDVTELLIADEFKNAIARPDNNVKDYAQFWHNLLWASEHQDMKDIQWYDIDGVYLQPEGRYILLHVPGLVEGRPSVLRGDVIEITWKDKLYLGRVQQVRQLEVVLQLTKAFHKQYNPSLDIVSVSFTFSRMTYRTSHAGCAIAPKSMDEALLFPTPAHIAENSSRGDPYSPGDWKWANPSLNEKQKLAVKNIVEGSSRPLPYIVFGPPGTGKTMTVVEAVYHLGKKCGSKILLVAPSNDAADILVARLSSYFPPSELRRPIAFSRPIEAVAKEILPFVTEGGPDVQEILSERTRIVVSTVNLAARFYLLGVKKGCFDVLVCDEAGHATEPEVVAVAASLMDFQHKAQIVLAGDPKQLGPVIRSDVCNEFGMCDSYMARLMTRDVYLKKDGEYPQNLVTKLVENYRSHPSIIKLPNEMFYDNDLVCSGDPLVTHSLTNWEHLPVQRFPVIFHSMDGDNLREANSPSWFNPEEAQLVVEYVRKLMVDTRPPLRSEDIGIITPYARQAQKIRTALENQGFRNMKIGSVETFQGQERRCIIVSTVRSLVDEVTTDKRHNLGFVANEKRFNVAITRAKALLIVIGCPRVLALDEENWLPFLRYCHEQKAWCGDEWDPEPEVPVQAEAVDEESWDLVDGQSIVVGGDACQEDFAFVAREE